MSKDTMSNIKAGAVVIGILCLLIVILKADFGDTGPAGIPECESKTTRQMLTDAVNNSVQGRMGLKVLDIGKIETVGQLLDDASNVRHRVCSADVMTNSSRKTTFFTLDWADEAKTKVYLQAPHMVF